jgi:hypothetical protein
VVAFGVATGGATGTVPATGFVTGMARGIAGGTTFGFAGKGLTGGGFDCGCATGVAGVVGEDGRKSNVWPQRGHFRVVAPWTACGENWCEQVGLGQGKAAGMDNRLGGWKAGSAQSRLL